MYLGAYWHCKADLENEFRLDSGDLDSCKIIVACYNCESYEGSAFILFEKGGNLYEVNGSHCSCYGLEDQWRPEETSVELLKHRIEHGTLALYLGCDTPDVMKLLEEFVKG